MNISLIGMPASGKTTIAKALKNYLTDFTVIDLDEEIENREKRTISEIFSEYGEDYFRELEASVLQDIIKTNNQIVSTGGGIIKKQENIDILKKNSTVVYLETGIDVLLERANNANNRPLIENINKEERLKILLNERENQYKQAHYIIKTSNKSQDEIAKEIIRLINGNDRN